MAAVTTDQNTQKRLGGYLDTPVAAATKIPAGVLVAQDATGYAVNATDAAARTFLGVSTVMADNTDGAAGAIDVHTEEGIFGPFAMAAALTVADVGKVAYVSFNHTIAVTGTSHSLIVGHVYEITSAGAWIDTRGAVRGNAPTS